MNPFQVGQTVPGYCCGMFPLETQGDTLRVEAVGYDWVVLRGHHGLQFTSQIEELVDNARIQKQMDESVGYDF